jgi:hypothetical protein
MITRNTQETPEAVYDAAFAIASVLLAKFSGSPALNDPEIFSCLVKDRDAAVDELLDTVKCAFIKAYLSGYTAAKAVDADAKAVESNPYHRVLESLRWARTLPRPLNSP